MLQETCLWVQTFLGRVGYKKGVNWHKAQMQRLCSNTCTIITLQIWIRVGGLQTAICCQPWTLTVANILYWASKKWIKQLKERLERTHLAIKMLSPMHNNSNRSLAQTILWMWLNRKIRHSYLGSSPTTKQVTSLTVRIAALRATSSTKQSMDMDNHPCIRQLEEITPTWTVQQMSPHQISRLPLSNLLTGPRLANHPSLMAVHRAMATSMVIRQIITANLRVLVDACCRNHTILRSCSCDRRTTVVQLTSSWRHRR